MKHLKNNKLIYTILSTSVISCNFLLSQAPPTAGTTNGYFLSQMASPTTNFKTLSDQADAYYIPLRSVGSPSITGNEKKFRRWQNYAQSHSSYPGVQPGGSTVDYANYVNSLFATTNPVFCASNVNTIPWQQAGDVVSNYNEMGLISSIAVDKNNIDNIYVGTESGGLFKTINRGLNWNNVTDNLNIPSLGVLAVAIDPSNSSHIIIGCSNASMYNGNLPAENFGVYQSFNGGSTWSTTNIGFNSTARSFEKIKFCPTNPNIIIACGKTEIYKSTDGGYSFNLVYQYIGGDPQSYHFNDIDFKISDNSKIMVTGTNFNAGAIYVDNYLMVSPDFGSTWVNKTPSLNAITGNTKSPHIQVDATPADPNNFYILTKTNNETKVSIYKTNDEGLTWVYVSQATQDNGSFGTYNAVSQWGEWTHQFEMSNLSLNNIYYGTIRFYKSSDGGNTVLSKTEYYPGDGGNTGPHSSHADIRAIEVIGGSTNDNIFVATDGGIILSYDNGETWNNINGSGLTCGQNVGLGKFLTNSKVIFGAMHNGTKVNTTGSSTFLHVAPGDGGNCEVDPTNDNVVFANVNGYLYKSMDQGTTFSSGVGFTDPKLLPKFKFMAGTSTLLVGQGTNLYTVDASNVKTTLPQPAFTNSGASKSVVAIGTSKTFPNIIYQAKANPTYGGYNSDKLFKSTDGGNTWADLTTNLGNATDWSTITDISIDPNNWNNIFISFDGFWCQGSDMTKGVKRVMHSVDGGTTWVDVSNGLPGHGVNCLAFQEGSDNVLYCGNEIGVYRFHKTDALTGYWECFSAGLPKCIISDIEINNCQRKIYCSSFGRGIFMTDLPDVTTPMHVTFDQTWQANTNRIFSTDVIVDPNVCLTINGTVNFSTGKKLIISPRAKVNLNGKLTNSCGDLWKGVELAGDNTHDQSFDYNPNGVLILKYQGWLVANNATIENAEEGVALCRTNNVGDLDWNSFGGRINATNSQFLNNWRDVSFLAYNYNNGSAFIRCNFETTKKLNNSSIPFSHVSLWENRGVSFKGCSFKYSAGSNYAATDHGMGINSFDAMYRIDAYCSSASCPSPVKTSFTDLQRGMEVFATNPLRTVDVNRSSFINNYRDGAYFNGISYLSLKNCEFNVGGDPLSTGIYLYSCKFYKVQNNSFSTTNNGKTGIYASNSGSGSHEIYRNTFSKLIQGISAIDNNGDNSSGARIYCNNLNNGSANQYDVTMLTTGGLVSVNPVQGLITSNPADLVGNAYGAACASTENKWFIVGSTSNGPIAHGSNAGVYAPLPQPSCSDPQVFINTTSSAYTQSQCPNKDVTVKVAVLSSNINQYTLALKKIKESYTSTIDGGSTEAMLSQVNSSTGVTLRDALVSRSPYLSDAVLLKYINKLPMESSTYLKDVIVSNSPLSPEVKTRIDQLILPTEIRNQINAAQTGISKRRLLEMPIISTTFNKDVLVNDKMRYYLLDTLSTINTDSIIMVLNKEATVNKENQIVQGYLVMNNLDKALSAMNTMQESDASLSSGFSYYRTLVDLKRNEKNYMSLKTNQSAQSTIKAIASDRSNVAFGGASSLFYYVYNKPFTEPRLLPNRQGARLGNSEGGSGAQTESLSTLFIKPNPAKDKAIITFSNHEATLVTLEIRDVMGKLIIKDTMMNGEDYELTTEKMPSGVYFVNAIGADGMLIESKKMLIAK